MSISSSCTDMVPYGFFDKDQCFQTDSCTFDNPSSSETPHAGAGQSCENKKFSAGSTDAFRFIYPGGEADKKIAALESKIACLNPSDSDLISFKKDVESIVLSTGTEQSKKMALWKTRDVWNRLMGEVRTIHEAKNLQVSKVKKMPETFSFSDTRDIYRACSVILHPDRQYLEHSVAADKFAELGQAYESATAAKEDITKLNPSFGLTDDDAYTILEHGSFQKTEKALFELDLSMFVDDDDLVYVEGLLN